MTVIAFVFRRLIRRPLLSLIGPVISCALCVLLCSLTDYRQDQQRQLEKIQSGYDILCVVTDARGTKSDDLLLSASYMEFIRDPDNGLGAFVRDLRLTKKFSGVSTLGRFDVVGLNSERSAARLDPSAGGEWSCSRTDFFETTDNVCLISQDLFDAWDGQTIHMQLTDDYGLEGKGRGEADFTVVGWYKGEGETLYIPYPCAEKLCKVISKAVSVDSVSFLLADNSAGDALIEAAAPKFLQIDPSYVNDGKFALTVHDRSFKATTAALENNIRRIGYLLPILSVLGLGTGFLIGFLSTRGEQKNYALMRTVGLSRGKLFIAVLLEQLLLPLLGVCIVAACMRQPVPAAFFFACLLIGTAIAVIKPVFTPPTRLLRE